MAMLHLITGGTPGLVHDARIGHDTIRPRLSTAIHILHRRNLHLPFQRLLLASRRMLTRRRDIGIFFENLPLSWIGSGDIDILIPNQEWMRPEALSTGALVVTTDAPPMNELATPISDFSRALPNDGPPAWANVFWSMRTAWSAASQPHSRPQRNGGPA